VPSDTSLSRPPHHTGQGNRGAWASAMNQHVRRQRALVAVDAGDLLAGPGSGGRRSACRRSCRSRTRCRRLAEFEEHVVGDIDDVVDRPKADGLKPANHPRGAGADLHVSDDSGGVVRAEVRRVDGQRGQSGRTVGGKSFGNRQFAKVAIQQGGQLAARRPRATGNRGDCS